MVECLDIPFEQTKGVVEEFERKTFELDSKIVEYEKKLQGIPLDIMLSRVVESKQEEIGILKALKWFRNDKLPDEKEVEI